MVTPNADSTPADSTINAASGRPPEAPASTLGQGRLLGMALVAGLLAGVAAWLVGETILEAYRDILTPKVKREMDAEVVRQFARAHLTSGLGTFAGLGAILGLSLGMAGGLARRSASAGAKAALVGCVVGSIAGFSVSLLVLPNFFKNYDPQSHDLLLPLLTLGSICASVGAAGGLAFGIGLGGRDRWMKSLLGGLVGAALATVVYELIGAIAFPADKTELPISQTHATRVMLHVLVAALTAVGSALGLGLSAHKRHAGPPRS
jgi:hypothetical protein